MRFLGLPLILSLLAAPAVWAEPVQPGTAWLEIVQGLQKQGVNSVGALNLQKLEADARNIKWRSTKEVPSVIAGSRTSAYYMTDTQEVFMSEDLPPDLKNSLGDLEMHEVFGALGYEDDKSTKSTALRILLEAPASQKKILLKELGKDIFHRDSLRIQEGGTSVSGGGDINSITIKNQVLREILNTSRVIDPQFLKNFPLLNFETVYAKDVDYISINYKFKGPRAIEKLGPYSRMAIKNGMQELITFYVPLHQWEKGPKQRKALIKELKAKVSGFYNPYLYDKAMIEIPICDRRDTVRIPKTSDRNVLYVQQFRWGLMKGCDPMDEFESGTTSPGLPERSVPFTPGHFYYECTMTQGKLSYSELVVIAQHSNTAAIVDVEMDGATINGVAQFDGKGGISQLLFYVVDGSQRGVVARKKLKNSQEKISYTHNKRPFTFGCEKR